MRYIAFPNGMTLEEGVQRAGDWWDDTGRELITRFIEGTPQDSGTMMSGVKWDKLTVREQHKVVNCWYKAIGQYL